MVNYWSRLRSACEALEGKEVELKRLRNAITNQTLYQPPSFDEYEKAIKRLHYVHGRLHIAVAGFSGVGKSSLVNALRGLRDKQPGAAATGTTETTSDIGRYPVNNNVIFYDIPGSGTMNVPVWDYFKHQGLYLMQRVIIVWSDRIMEDDVRLMMSCIIANIPFFLVRSKCDHQLENFRNDIKELLSLDDGELDDKDFLEAFRDKVNDFRVQTSNYAQRLMRIAYSRTEIPISKSFSFQECIYFINSRSLFAWISEGIEDCNTLDEKRFHDKISLEIGAYNKF